MSKQSKSVSAKQDKSTQELVFTDDNPYTQCSLLQRRYVEGRLQGLAPMAASRAAGAKATCPTQLEKNPKVQAAIRFCVQQSAGDVTLMTKSDVMVGMLDAVSAAATASELVMAWRELGKLIGAYEPEKKILEIHDYTRDELKTMSDDDLIRLSGGKFKEAVDAEFHEVLDD